MDIIVYREGNYHFLAKQTGLTKIAPRLQHEALKIIKDMPDICIRKCKRYGNNCDGVVNVSDTGYILTKGRSVSGNCELNKATFSVADYLVKEI